METRASNSPHPLVWVAAIALIVFCGAGVAALMGGIPTSLFKSGAAAFAPVVVAVNSIIQSNA